MIRPILFNTEMVQAIQAGRKTVTRRLVKDLSRPPYETGDVLWVRETWAFWPCITCGAPCVSNPKAGIVAQFGRRPDTLETADGLTEGCFLYRADGEAPVFPGGHIWRASIHMPKQAARIFLRVEEVRPERLQESVDNGRRPTMAELYAEGVDVGADCRLCGTMYGSQECRGEDFRCVPLQNRRAQFAELWDSTIPKDKLETAGWAADPMVWVIRFRVCEKPEGWPG